MKRKEVEYTPMVEAVSTDFTGVLDKIVNSISSTPTPAKPHYTGKFNAFTRLTNAKQKNV